MYIELIHEVKEVYIFVLTFAPHPLGVETNGKWMKIGRIYEIRLIKEGGEDAERKITGKSARKQKGWGHEIGKIAGWKCSGQLLDGFPPPNFGCIKLLTDRKLSHSNSIYFSRVIRCKCKTNRTKVSKF